MKRPKSKKQRSSIECPSCGYCGKILAAHHGYKWWMLPLGILIACTGVGVIPLAMILIPMGNRTYDTCPNCKSEEVLDWIGEPSSASGAIWKKAKEADDKTFLINKLILLATVLVMLAAALVFLYRFGRW